MRNFVSNLRRSCIALQVAEKIASCNRANSLQKSQLFYFAREKGTNNCLVAVRRKTDINCTSCGIVATNGVQFCK